jgi:PAS domain-containing protein
MVSRVTSSPALSSDEMNGFFKRMLDNLFDAVYFTDLQRRIRYWNLAAEDLTGYGAEEVVGKCCADNIIPSAAPRSESCWSIWTTSRTSMILTDMSPEIPRWLLW